MDWRRFEIKTRRSPSAKPANLQLMSKRMECFFLFKCRAHTDRADLHFFCGRGGFFSAGELLSAAHCVQEERCRLMKMRDPRAHPDENSMFCKKI